MSKQSSVEWLIEQIDFDANERCFSQPEWFAIFQRAKTMHKEEMKMIIEHYHNKMFYLELTEIELENITKMIYKEIFGGQDNEN